MGVSLVWTLTPPLFLLHTLQSNLIHSLGLSHHLITLNFIIVSFGKKSAKSSPKVQVTDTDFDGVEVRVFEGSPKPDEELRRSVVYIHGGGWALASASKSLSPSGGSGYFAWEGLWLLFKNETGSPGPL